MKSIAYTHSSNLLPISIDYSLPNSYNTNSNNSNNDLNDLNDQSTYSNSIINPLKDFSLLNVKLSNNNFNLVISSLPTTSPPLSINLHSQVIPSIGIYFDDDSNSIHLLLVTQSCGLLRLNIPLFVLNNPSTENLPDGWATEYILNCADSDYLQISTVHPVDIGTILLGMIDGSIIMCEQPRGNRTLLGKGLISYYETQWTENLMKQSSILSSVRSILPNPFNSNNNSAIGPPSQIISLTAHVTETSALAFTLSRDRKLRIWSLIHRSCVRTIALGDQYDLIAGDPRKLIKTYSSDTDDEDGFGFVIVHLPDYANPAFYIYSFEISRNGGVGELNLVAERSSEPGLELHDVAIVKPSLKQSQPILWALYEKSSIPLIKHTELPELTSDSSTEITEALWESVAQAPIIPLDPAAFSDYVLSAASGTSIPDIFLDVIFTPGAFSPLTISRAISEYTTLILNEIRPENRPIKLLEPPVYDTLLDHAAEVVGCHIELEYDQSSGVPRTEEYQNKIKFEWLRFASLVGETHARAQLPLHLAIHDQLPHQVIIIQSEAISVPVLENHCQIIRRLTDPNLPSENINSFINLPESSFKDISDVLVKQDSRMAILRVFTLARSLSQMIPLNTLRSLEDSILNSSSTLVDDAVEVVLRNIWQENTSEFFNNPMSVNLLDNIKKTISMEIDAFIIALESSLQILIDIGFTFTQDEKGIRGELTDDMSKTLVASALMNQLKDRYFLARDLIMLVIFADSNNLLGSKSNGLLNRSLNIFHRTALLRWVALRGVREEPEFSKIENDGLTDKFGAMHVTTSSTTDNYPKLPASSLIHAILRTPKYTHVAGLSTFEEMQNSINYLPLTESITNASNRLLKFINLLIDQPFIETRSSDAIFAQTLLEFGWDDLVSSFVEFWPGSCGLSYVNGKAKVYASSFEEAKHEFEIGASGLLSNDEILKSVLPKNVKSLGKYYEHVAYIFESVSADDYVSHFAQYALDEILQHVDEDLDIDVRLLWSKLFRSQAIVGKYEEAYTTLVAIPYSDIQSECLRYLVSAMCETGDVARLVQFPFTALQSELERTLAFKARNSDALDKPNYYQILYSYYIFRGNFRDAGSIMYQHGRRLAELPCRPSEFGELATLQARAYLAAVNALSLVNPDNAWVVLPVTPESTANIRKRRKLTSFIPESEFNNESKTLEIVRLNDIRNDYTLVLARLQLAQQFPELTHANLSMAPEDIIALFVQRGLFSIAISTARILDVDMTGIFINIASRCLHLSKLGELADESELGEWILLDEVASSWHGSISERAWNYLRGALDKHDSLDRTHGKYRIAILENIFEQDRTFDGVPSWLLSMFAAHLTPELIRIYFKFDLIQDALSTCVKVLEQANSRLKLSSNKQNQYLPYTLIDRVIDAANEKKGDEKIEGMVNYLLQLHEDRTKLLSTMQSNEHKSVLTNGI